MKSKYQNIILNKIKKILQISRLIILQLLIAYNLFFVSDTFSQTITKSYPDKVSSRFSDYEIIGKNDFGIIVHYFGNNESQLVVYDDKLMISKAKELPFKGKAATLEDFILLKDKILIFYTTNSENYLYYKLKILDDKLNIPNETILLDSIPSVSVGNNKAFYVKTSPDKSKILLFSSLKTKSNYFVRFSVMSESLQILNRNIFTLTDANRAALKSIKINNSGNVIAIVGNENGNSTNDYDYTKYTTFTFNRATNTIGEQVMQRADYVYKNLITELSTQREIAYISASYKNTNTKNDIGIAYQVIDLRTNTVLMDTKLAFNEEMLQKSQTHEFKTWQDKAELVRPKKIVIRSDGGFVLVTEGEFTLTRVERMSNNNNFGYYNSMPIAPSVRYIDQNNFYDISVFSINKDGTLDWQSTIPKVQVSENDNGYYSSFAFFEADNVLKFLYNEDFYNIGNFVEYNVNPNGLAKRQSVMNSEKQNLVIVPQKAKQLDGHSIVFPSEQKRNLQFVLFQY